MNITTGAALAALPEHWLRRHLGGVVGQRLWRELHGQPCLEWNPTEWDEEGDQLLPSATGRHSVTCTRSFGRPQHDAAVLAEAVATFAAKAAEKLRRQGLAAHLITVVLGTNRFAATAGPNTHTAVVSLAAASSDVSRLTQAALCGLRRLQRPGTAYHRAGILLSGLEPAGRGQVGLFPDAADQNQPRRDKLMTTLDALNARFGRQLVRLAAAGVAKNAHGQPQAAAWAGRSAHRSPCYTTDWNDLWTVQLGI